MSMRIEDTEGGKEAEFIVLDFIKSTPNASVADIATLINDVGADLNYLATVLNVDPVIARQAYSEVISTAPPIQEVIKKQIDSNPVVPPTRPLDQVIDPSGPAFSQEEIDNVVGQLTRGDKTPSEIAQQYGVSEDFVNTNLQIVQEQAFQDLNSGAKTPEQVASQYNLSNEFVVSNLARVNQERNIAPDIVPPVNDDSERPIRPVIVDPERPILPSVPDAQLPVGLAAAEQAALGGAGTATGLLGATAGSAGRELTAGTLGGIGALRGGIGQARQDIMQGTQTGIGALQQALGGARADIESGFTGGRGDIQQALAQSRGDIQSGFGRAEAMFDPYAQAGGQALQQQLALSGALGPEAFQQAYQESPQMRFLQEQGERAALRTAGARGGLGGGRVMQELARYNTGLASQDLQNQIANLQALSAQGLGARGSAANIATGGSQQLAGLASGAGQNLANLSTGQAQQLASLGVLGGTSGLQAATQQGTQLANLAQQLGVSEADLRTSLGAGRSNIALGIGTRAADLAAQTGLNVAGMRTRAGEQLERQFGTTASQMGGLQQGMGSGTAQMIGGQTDLVSRLQQAAAQGDAAAQTELASMQAQGYSNIGAQLAGVPQASTFVPQSPISGALGGAVVGARLGEMFPQQQQVQAPVFDSQPYVPTASLHSGATVYPGNTQFGGNPSSMGIIRNPLSLSNIGG